MRQITYLPSGINNFHNSPPIILRITGKRDPITDGYIVTKRQAQRISAHFCGVSGCCCPAGALQQLDPEGNFYSLLKAGAR